MNTKKYTDGMTLNQFIYANYGFTVTPEQQRKAFADWVNLSSKKNKTN